MRVMIWQTHYYDWEKVPAGTAVTEADFQALRAKVLHDNTVAMRVQKPAPEESAKTLEDGTPLTYTEVGISDSQISSCEEHFERIGQAKTRPQVVAFLLEKVIPHHGHPQHFVQIECHDEPQVESFLNAYFQTSGGKLVSGGAK